MRYILSADLGQLADFTALTVVRTDGKSGQCIHLERLPLGTDYVTQVKRIKQVYQDVLKFRIPTDLIVDGTGVGVAVLDLIRAAGLNPIAITLTGGDTARKDGLIWHIPKRDIISALIVAYQTGAIKISKSLPEADTLNKELSNFKLKINLKTGHDTYESWRENIHDDMVLSLGMSVYAAGIGQPPVRQVTRPTPRRRDIPKRLSPTRSGRVLGF